MRGVRRRRSPPPPPLLALALALPMPPPLARDDDAAAAAVPGVFAVVLAFPPVYTNLRFLAVRSRLLPPPPPMLVRAGLPEVPTAGVVPNLLLLRPAIAVPAPVPVFAAPVWAVPALTADPTTAYRFRGVLRPAAAAAVEWRPHPLPPRPLCSAAGRGRAPAAGSPTSANLPAPSTCRSTPVNRTEASVGVVVFFVLLSLLLLALVPSLLLLLVSLPPPPPPLLLSLLLLLPLLPMPIGPMEAPPASSATVTISAAANDARREGRR